MNGARFTGRGTVITRRPSAARVMPHLGRWGLVLALLIAVLVILPLPASAYLSTGSAGDNSWSWQNPIPQGNTIYSLSFADSNTGWAVGRSGLVLKTTDAGTSWQFEDCGTTNDLTGGSFVDASNGWVAGLAGTIRHTSNGGSTWIGQTSGTSNSLEGISFADASHGVAVGLAGTIRYTSNGGSNWASGVTTSAVALNGVAMSSATQAWAVGASGTILRSVNGGANWTPLASPVAVTLNSVTCAPGTNIAYAVGAANGTSTTILKTTDGTTWAPVASTPANSLTLYSVACSADGSVVEVTGGANGGLYRSTDGGTTWTVQKAVVSSNAILRSVKLPDATHVYAAGDSGAMVSSSNSGASWVWKMQGTAANMVAASFVSTSTGYAVGSAGTIVKTTDGGSSWSGMSATPNNLTGVMFLNASTGWAVGAAGTIIKTTDGGATWTAQTSGVATALNAVWFIDANTGLAGGASGVLLRTTNGGSTWTPVTSGAAASAINSIWFADANTGYIACAAGKVGKTTNGGTTWVTARPAGIANVTLYGIRGTDASNVWACGNSGTIAKTSTGGGTWATSTSGTTQPLYGIFFANANRGWVAGAYGTVKTTIDGGSTWTDQNAGMPTATSETNVPARAFAFLDANNGFLFGDAGTIRRTTNGGTTWLPSFQGGILQLNGITFTDASNGWLVGSTATIQRTTDGGRNWYVLKAGVTSNLYGVAMSDANTGWVVGATGTIRKTTDAGQTWPAQTSGTTNQLNGVACSGSSSAIAVGITGTIKYTTNGGSTWTTATTVPTAQNINGVCMSSAATGWAVATYSASSSRIMRTADGGATWAGQTTTSTASLYGVQFLADGRSGWAVGTAGTILKTTDGGATWTVRPSGTAVTLYAVSFADANNGCVVGASGTILRSIDGGATWTTQQSGSKYHILRGVRFIDPAHGWVVGDAGAILPTTADNTPPTTTLGVSPASPNGLHGWYNSPPTMTLSRNELGTTSYSWVATSGPYVTYIAPVIAPEGAATTIYYYSADLSNNVETAHSYTVNTDYTPPTSPLNVTASGVTTSSATIAWASSTDSGSGVDHYGVYLNGVLAASPSSTSTALTGLSPNTNYTVTVVAVDYAGLVSSASAPLSVTTPDLDRAPIVTSLALAPALPDGANSWYVTTPTVTLTSSPATASATIHVSWDSSTGPFGTYVAPIAAPSGTHILWYYATDNAGIRNDESKHQVTLSTDTKPPSTPTSVTADVPSTSTVNLSWSRSTDNASGVQRYDLLVNGQLAGSTASTSAVLTGLSPGITYSATVLAIDAAGLQSAQSTPVSFTMQTVDRTPLATFRTVAPALPDGQNGWYVTPTAITLASLPTAVPSTIYYSWTSAGGPWSSYTSTLTPADGVQTLWYYAHDNSGVRDDEAVKSVSFKSDLTPPNQPSGLIPDTPTTSSVSVNWSAPLGGSAPLDHYEVFVNGQYVQGVASTGVTLTGLAPNTSYSITVVGVDEAGRSSLPSLPAFVLTQDLDRTPLVTTLSNNPASPDGLAGWYASPPIITLVSSPTTVPADIYYSWASGVGPWTAYVGSFVPADGSGVLYYFARDRSGQRNDEAVRSVSYKVDSTPPTTPGPVTASGVTFSAASISWTPSLDAASGLDHYRVLLNGVPYANTASTGTALSGLAESTTYTVSVTAFDVAGNQSTAAALTFHTDTIDRTPLVTSVAISPATPDGSNGWYLTAPTLTLSSAPTTVPATTLYSWDTNSGPWTQYTGETLSPAEGLSTLWYQSSDLAGYRNAETPKRNDFKVDSVDPLAPSAVTTVTVGSTSATIAWSGESPGSSPVDHFAVYVNGLLRATSTSHTATLTGLGSLSTYTITVATISQSGRFSDQSLGLVLTTGDASPLVTSASVAPAAPNGSNGWYVTTPTVTLASSPSTVPATTYYAWDASALATYTAPIAVPAPGTHVLSYRSGDVAGQRGQESTKSATFKLDTSSPVAPDTLSASALSTSSLSVTWSGAADPQSGVDHYDLWVGGTKYGTFAGTGATVTGLQVNTSYAIYVVAVNGAGLSAVSASVSGTTLSNPAVSCAYAVTPAGPDGLHGWFVSAPTVILSSNPTSVPAWIYAGWDGSALTTYTPGFALAMPGEGAHRLSFYAADQSDPSNRDATGSVLLKQDTVAPAPPVSVQLTPLDTGSIAASWTAGFDGTSGVDHYLLYVDGVATTVTGTSTVISGLSPNSLHSFAVASVDAASNIGSQTALYWATTNALPPLVTSASTDFPADGANGWYITTPTVTFSVSPSLAANTYYTWDASALATVTGGLTPPAGTHTLSFWSVDTGRTRSNEDTQQLTTQVDTVKPGTPALTASATAFDTVHLAWTPVAQTPSTIAGYTLWMDGAYAGLLSGSFYDVVGLRPLSTHTFRLAAINVAGTSSSYSTTLTVTTPNTPRPSAPSVVLAVAPTDGYANVNWTPATDVVGPVRYRVLRSSDGVHFSAIATNSGGVLDTTYEDSGLKSSTPYWYSIITVDGRGDSVPSATDASVWGSIAATTGPPSRPVGLAAVAGSNQVELSWQPSSNPNVIGYYVLSAPRSLAATATTLTALPIASTYYTDTLAQNGGVYYYSVRAVDASGTIGQPSLEVEARPLAPFAETLSPHNDDYESQGACICHSAHTGSDEIRTRFPGATKDTLCQNCHPPANSLAQFTDPLAASRHPEGSSVTTQTPYTCGTCHRPVKHSNEDTASLLLTNGAWACVSVTGTPAGDGFCYKCHGVASTLPQGDLTGFENSGHANVVAPATGANVKCDTCHEPHASRNEHLNRFSGYMMCMQCHTSATSNPNEPDIWSRLQLNEDANAKHPILPQDQVNGARMSCQNCHNTHTSSATYPLVDPHNPSPSGKWATPRSNEKAFCFTCHNGAALPTSAETTPWADPVLASNAATTVTDIQSAYQVNVHGFGQRSNPTTTTAFLRPDMGYQYGSVLECRSCHDPHGTPNNYALQTNVASADGAKTISGVMVAKVPGGGYDFRFFCSTCHLWDSTTHDAMTGAVTTTFPTNCMRCHRHMQTNGTTPSPNL